MNRMNRIRKSFAAFFRKARMKGFYETLNFAVKKLTGRLRLEEGIDTLYYLLNHYVDITKLPPAEGLLRKLQLCDAVLLSIFDSVCRKQNWTYWLCGGTLLGSVRHKGFIPWDDDLDVYMPRKYYDEIPKKCSELFGKYGIVQCDVKDFIRSGSGHCIGYKPSETGIVLDIFPVDTVRPESDDENESIKILTKKLNKYQRFYYANIKKMSYKSLSEAREKILGSTYDGEDGLCLHYPEFAFNYIIGKPYIFPHNVIFPLKTEQFEGLSLNVPNDTHTYLTGIFGNYMQFPRSGLEHHSRVLLPENSGVNLDEILEELKNIKA